VQTRRWVNQSQPQTLFFSTILLYFNVVWVILKLDGASAFVGAAIDGHKLGGGLFVGDLGQTINNLARLFIAVGGAAAGYLISNEKKYGYYLGVAVAGLPLVAEAIIVVRFAYNPFNFDLVTIMFQAAQLALILHPQSRNYVRLWFK
jgi:hypothetical protein